MAAKESSDALHSLAVAGGREADALRDLRPLLRVGLQPRILGGCAAVLPLAAAELHKVARIARDGAGGVAFGAADVVRRVGVAAPVAVAAQIPRAQVKQQLLNPIGSDRQHTGLGDAAEGVWVRTRRRDQRR